MQLQKREKALEELLAKQQEQQHHQPRPQRDEDTEDLNSIESMREDGEIREIQEPAIELPEYLDTSTRPTTPNKNINIPEIAQEIEEVSLPVKRKMQVDLEEYKIYRKYYEELRLHMNANEMETMQTCAKLTEQIVSLETDLLKIQKSYEYMKEDFDKNLSDMKHMEMEHIKKETDFKTKLSSLQQTKEELKHDLENHKNLYIYNTEDYKALQQSLNESQMKLALLTEELLVGKHDLAMKIPELCTDYGIIREDLQLDYITQQEFEAQRHMVKEFEGQKFELQRKITQLESLLEIAQDQIVSQQRLLNDITDNHINLRHLVADLQSSTEEKLLMAKMQRDLDTGE